MAERKTITSNTKRILEQKYGITVPVENDSKRKTGSITWCNPKKEEIGDVNNFRKQPKSPENPEK